MPRGDAEGDLLAQVRGELGLEPRGGRVIQPIVACLGAIEVAYLVVRGLHADENAANLTRLDCPRLDQIIYGLPASQVQISDAEIGARRHRQSGAQGTQQLLFDVVENSGHWPP